MKSISLKDIKSYVQDLEEPCFQNFKSNFASYKMMWSIQGFEFWVKFVVTLRDFYSANSSKYDDRCEKEMINFLKVITDKGFSELANYISEAHAAITEIKVCFLKLDETEFGSIPASEVDLRGHIRALMLKLKCAGTFINLLKVWNNAQVGKAFSYSPPESWFLPASLAEPFEAYIRSKWGNNKANVEQILGCKIEDLGWWNAPAKKVDQSKLKPLESDKQTSTPQPSGNSKKKKKNVKEERTKKERKSNVPLWVPNQLQSLVFPVTPKPPQLTGFLLKLKPLLHYSIPPLLQRKYHTVSPNELDNGQNISKSYMGVAPWYILVCDTFSNSYLNYVNDEYLKFQEMRKMPPSHRILQAMGGWDEFRDHDKLVLINNRDKEGSAHEVNDSVNELSEFILEPFIHLQVPWQPTICRQWLAASLIEILKFELEIIEFRHWPLTQELEPIVRQLLFLVLCLKERILLGWYISSYEATLNKGPDSHYPVQILEQVLIPSLPALKFICSAESKNNVQSLKKLAWSNFHESIVDKVNVSNQAFTENITMSNFFIKFYGHFIFWDQTNSISTLFVTSDHKNDSMLKDQIQEINNRTLPGEGKPFAVQNLKTDEEKFLGMIRAECKTQSGSINLDKASQIIRKILPKCPHFSQEKSRQIIKLLNSEEAKLLSENIFKPKRDTKSPLGQLILSGVICFEISKRIGDLSKEKGILACMMNMSALVMEKEQMIRIFAACSLLVNECPRFCIIEAGMCPVSCYVSKTRPMDIKEITSVITKVIKQTKICNKKQFFSNFPEKIKKPVDVSMSFPSLNDGFAAIISDLELRVRRFVWNIAQHNYEKTKKEKQDAYMHANVVQYLLPCYISFLVEAAKFPNTPRDNKKRKNLYKFVCGLLSHYEYTFEAWIHGFKIQEKMKIVDESDTRLSISGTLASYLVETISFALHGFAGVGTLQDDSDTMPHMKNLMSVMMVYCMFNNRHVTSVIEFLNCDAHVNIACSHFYVLHKICFTELGVPSPDSLLYCHELQDLYFASTMVHFMEIFCTLQVSWYGLQYVEGQITKEHEILHELMKPTRLWRNELFLVLFETEGQFDYPKSMLSNFVNGKGPHFLKRLFDAFISVRARYKSQDELLMFYFPAYKCVELEKTIKLYLAGQLKTLPLFQQKKTDIVEKFIQKPGVLIKCNNCKRLEKIKGTFVVCKACIDDKYPLPNYFCNVRCQEAWWQTEHHAEHLEFDLGLCDFSDLKL